MKVLVVEDEPGLAAALEDGLTSNGFAVDIATSGAAGLELAKSSSHDAIILDLLLPGMSGFKVCQLLREADIWAPVLVLTAKDGEFDEIEALDTGADDFMTKPFSFPVLLARLRALLRRGSSERPVLLRVGDLVLDPAGRSCERNGSTVHLTVREHALLEYLMRRAGSVVSKTELLNHVWSSDFRGDPNIVEVYIGYLRRKLDLGPFHRYITTIRGAGYRLEAPGT
jgi:DNA-binding response OmpR family regulator